MCSFSTTSFPPSSSPSTRAARRDEARLLVFDRATDDVRHRSVADLPDEVGEPARRRERHARRPRAPRGAARERRRRRGAARRASAGRRLGGAGAALTPAARGREARGRRRGRRGARGRSATDRWRIRLRGAPHGELPLPPYIHERARRSRAVPDGLRDRGRVGRGADGGPPLHARAARAGRPRADHAPRRARHVPAGHGRHARGARAPRRAVSRRAGGLAADRGGRAGARRGDDDDSRPRDGRAGRAAGGPVRRSSSRRASGFAGSMRC